MFAHRAKLVYNVDDSEVSLGASFLARLPAELVRTVSQIYLATSKQQEEKKIGWNLQNLSL